MPEMELSVPNKYVISDIAPLLVWSYMAHPDDENQRSLFFFHKTHPIWQQAGNFVLSADQKLNQLLSQIERDHPGLLEDLLQPNLIDPRRLCEKDCQETIRALNQHLRFANLTAYAASRGGDINKLLAESPPTKKIEREAMKCLTHGKVAGYILFYTLTCAEHHQGWESINRASYVVSKLLKKGNEFVRMSWKKYRKVSHLWLTLIFAEEQFEDSGDWADGSFNGFIRLSREGVLKFLAISEAYRDIGEKTYAPAGRTGSSPMPKPVLEDPWRCPTNLLFPDVELPEFLPLLPEVAKHYKKYRAR